MKENVRWAVSFAPLPLLALIACTVEPDFAESDDEEAEEVAVAQDAFTGYATFR